jgi:hypothetical protein
VHDGVLKRVVYEKHPRRFEYRLTEKGFDLYPLIATMTQWGDRWMAGRAGVPMELVHRPCGHTIKPKLVCPSCELKIDARDMSARPGPALKGRPMPGHDTSSPPRKVARRTQKSSAISRRLSAGNSENATGGISSSRKNADMIF